MIKTLVFSVVILAAAIHVSGCESRVDSGRLNLLIVVDGLRPDYITADLMPNLYALGERGAFADAHSVAFPSVTRVNSASISTGSYAAGHGIVSNTMFVAGISDKPFSTGSARNLNRLAEFSGGRLMSSPSLGELLDENGMRLFVTGTGGSGNSLLQNPVPGSGMAIWTAGGFFVPADARAEAISAVGDLPKTRSAKTRWAFDAYLHKALGNDPPEAVIMWINEPDSAGHRHGVGAPETLQAVANVDAQIGRVIAAHTGHGLLDRVNIFVTSDHGYSTSKGAFSAARTLRENGLGLDDQFTVVGNMIFLAQNDPALLTRVVEAFQRDPEAGNIYTRPAHPGSSDGIVPGTLSTALLQWDHEHSADVFVSPKWNDESNEFGFPGSSTRGGRSAAGHGSDSPYDLRVRLVAAGPDVKKGYRSRIPTGNVDLAPTILHLLGIKPPPAMHGRVLHELLRDGASARNVDSSEATHCASVVLPGGLRYEAALHTAKVGSTVYLRGSETARARIAEEADRSGPRSDCLSTGRGRNNG